MLIVPVQVIINSEATGKFLWRGFQICAYSVVKIAFTD